MAKPKSPPVQADTNTSIRLTPAELWFLEELRQRTGISNNSEQIRNCIWSTAKQHGISPPPRPKKAAK